MATTHQDLQSQYFALINKHKRYLQEIEEFRLVNRALTREVHNLQVLDDVVYSNDYQYKIDEAITKYQQYQALQRKYREVLNEEKVKPQELQLAKLKNDRLRQTINQLNFEVRQAETKESIFWQNQQMHQQYWRQIEQNLKQTEQQIQKLKSEHTLQQLMWCRLARERIKGLLLEAEDKEHGMNNEQEGNLTQGGKFYRLIAYKSRDVEQLAFRMQDQLRVLKQRQITSQQLKIQNDLVSKTFGFDSLVDQKDDEEQLRRQEQRLQREIMQVNEQIERQKHQKDNLRANIHELARAGAIQKTIDYLKHEQAGMQQNWVMIEGVLAAVEVGGDEAAKQQAKQMSDEIRTIKSEMEVLQNQVRTVPIVVQRQ